MEEQVKETDKRKKLISQIIKFGFVGGTSFIIDYLITLGVSALCRMAFGMDVASAAAVGGLFGFCISLIYNYFMSMKFVFERREDMDRKKEFAIFAILSLIGLGLNELILYFGVVVCDKIIPSMVADHPSIITTLVKMFATGVVMVYNFISRKMTLEKR